MPLCGMKYLRNDRQLWLPVFLHMGCIPTTGCIALTRSDAYEMRVASVHKTAASLDAPAGGQSGEGDAAGIAAANWTCSGTCYE